MRNVYTVTQVNAYIKNMFAMDYLLASVFLKGEVSNCKYHSSGHIYFTLKDEKSLISCVMFEKAARNLKFTLKEGQSVIVGGRADVYERDGKYQIYASDISLDGAGTLYEEFERRKLRLSEMGMFAKEYKRDIPLYVRRLGVVTSAEGAAVRDIIQIAKRRNPYIEIFVYPAIVQGERAAESIVNGIRAIEAYGADVIIVGRGGGSIEDLWAFNEEIVADAVFNCEIPIISAVGHETDTTITDFVADLRAPTPSAAAELAVCEISALLGRVNELELMIKQRMTARIAEKRADITRMTLTLKLVSPDNKLRERKMTLLRFAERLNDGMQKSLGLNRQRISILAERLNGLSPLGKLSMGYAYVSNSEGNAINSVKSVTVGENISIHVTDGIIEARVTKKVGESHAGIQTSEESEN